MTSVTELVADIILLAMSRAFAANVFDRAFAMCCLNQLKDTLCISLYCHTLININHNVVDARYVC